MARSKANQDTTSRMGRRRAAAQTEQGAYYQQRRADLCTAAAELFREFGLSSVSLHDIGQKAGINRASIYYYASSKEELFFEIALGSIDRFIAHAEEVCASADDSETKIRRFIIGMMMNYEKAYPHLYVFIQEHLSQIKFSDEERHAALLKRTAHVDTMLRGLIDGAVADGTLKADCQPSLLAYAILGMINWSHRWFRPDGKLSGKEIGEAFADMILGGVLARERG